MQELAEDIYLIEGSDLVFAGATMGTRSTVARLTDGSLWVHSPVQMTEEVLKSIEQLGGTVSVLIAPNKFHYLYLQQWVDRWPEAQVFADSALKKKVKDLPPNETISDEAPAIYADEFDQLVFDGNKAFQESVFFHKASRTAIFTDLLINVCIEHQPLLARTFLKFEQVASPNGGIPRLFKLTSNKKRARANAEKILAWQPQRLIFSHGDAFTDNADDVLRREFGWLLSG